MKISHLNRTFILFDEYHTEYKKESYRNYGVYVDDQRIEHRDKYFITEGSVIFLSNTEDEDGYTDILSLDHEIVDRLQKDINSRFKEVGDYPEKIADAYESLLFEYQKRQQEIKSGVWEQKTFTECHDLMSDETDIITTQKERYQAWKNKVTGEILISLDLPSPENILLGYRNSKLSEEMLEELFKKWVMIHFPGKIEYEDE